MRHERRAFQVGSPNVVSLLGSGTERGVDFLVLPYLDGVLAPGGSQPRIAPLNTVGSWIPPVVSGLRAIHEEDGAGDLKPDHLSIDRHFHVTLLDFGMALPLFQRTSDMFSEWIESEAVDDAKCSDVPVWGSPVYMPPEAFLKNALIEPSRDVYSLGCMLYLWITGQRPFYAKSLSDWKKSHLSQRPKNLRFGFQNCQIKSQSSWTCWQNILLAVMGYQRLRRHLEGWRSRVSATGCLLRLPGEWPNRQMSWRRFVREKLPCPLYWPRK